jgi:hypothetical protein
MISQSDIEAKDFSIEFPIAIQKTAACSEALLMLADKDDDPYAKEALQGLGYILDDVVTDLKVIENAIYPK